MRSRLSRVRIRRSTLTAIVGASALLVLVGCGSSTPAAVNVFPLPGGRVASPETQISFRGIAIGGLGRIAVRGSRSGLHAGRVEADSDGKGGSFLPNRPFSPGEAVTVRVGSTLLGSGSHRTRSFQFTVATPAGPLPDNPLAPAPRQPGDVQQFRSRPDLQPPAIEITQASARVQAGDIFLAPQQGPLQNGPMIIDSRGKLVWFHPLPGDHTASDFRVQRFQGRAVLTWWEGYMGAGVGVGRDVIFDTSYRQMAVVRAGNGLAADLHEFQLTPAGTALITAYYPIYWNASAVHGGSHVIVLDSVVQEIDIRTGLVLFQWDSLDHVPLTDTYLSLPATHGHPFDYFHINSVQADSDGSLIISGRNTWAVYKVDSASARTIWTLGGKRSNFKMGAGAQFVFQHDVRVDPPGDTTMTVFDDGAGPPTVHAQSRGLELQIGQHTAKVIGLYGHSPALSANFEGSMQPLSNGDQFLGWGQQPYFTEYTALGFSVFDGRFVDANASYRAYRLPWSATPHTVPVIRVVPGSGSEQVFASWNGATAVASWRILAGPSRTDLRSVSTAPKADFETELRIRSQPYVAVQALDGAGRVLATSATAS